VSEDPLPASFFERADESPDPLFYTQPRLVTHIDDVTIEALRDYYREALPRDGEILDLMSSWVSHLPDDVAYSRIAGLGMNALELDQNPRLHERVVHDLNTSPELPFADASFDAVINAVSVQYLKRPLEVFAEVARVLRPGGVHLVAYSHRMFPTKAVAVWRSTPPHELKRVVETYFNRSRAFSGSRGWEDLQSIDRSPPFGDPLWITRARRARS